MGTIKVLMHASPGFLLSGRTTRTFKARLIKDDYIIIWPGLDVLIKAGIFETEPYLKNCRYFLVKHAFMVSGKTGAHNQEVVVSPRPELDPFYSE